MEHPRADEWLEFASTQSPLRLWLSMAGTGTFVAALSQAAAAATVPSRVRPSGDHS